MLATITHVMSFTDPPIYPYFELWPTVQDKRSIVEESPNQGYPNFDICKSLQALSRLTIC